MSASIPLETDCQAVATLGSVAHHGAGDIRHPKCTGDLAGHGSYLMSQKVDDKRVWCGREL